MSLEHDPRTGSEDSDNVVVVAGDNDVPQTVLSIPATALFKPTSVRIEYDDGASVNARVGLYDDDDGTTNANLSEQRDEWLNIAPGDRVETEATYRAFENDVLVATDGNQDGELSVTVNGVTLTDLKDISGF